MAVAGAATAGTALTASLSSKLFMATADPSTLMTLGKGVGSAVMGTSLITGQAAFIPVAGTVPVAAPMMAVHALSTAVTLQQFQQVDRKLDTIKSTLDTAIARSEATHVGELLTTSRVVDEVYRLYGREGSFSSDMWARLALAERDVGRLAERSRLLVDSRPVVDLVDATDVQQANYDAYSAMLASFLDLRIAYLRVCVDMQEHPRSVESSAEQLKTKINDDIEFWQRLLNRSDALREAIAERETRLLEMSKTKRALPGIVGGGSSTEKEIEGLKTAYTSTIENERKILKGFDSLIESAEQTLRVLSTPGFGASSPTLIYWRDESGEHSFYTNEIGLTNLRRS